MGIFEGLVGGFGKSYAGHQKETAARTAKQQEQEQQILSTLLGSDNPEIQMRAMQAMIQGASGKAKKKGGISGFLGETEPSPAFTGMFDYLRGMDEKSRAGTPDTVTDTVEGGIPTQTITAGAEGTPTTLFKSPEQRRVEAGGQERAAMTGELAGMGASKEAQMQAVYGTTGQVAPTTPPIKTTTISDQSGQHLVDASTGQIIATFGPEPEKGGQTRVIATDKGQFLVDSKGTVIQEYDPRPQGEGVPRDEPGYLNAQAAKEQIESALVAKYSKLDLDMGQRSPKYQEIQAMRDALAVQFNFDSYDDVLRNAATRRGEMGMGMPPSAEGGQGISGQGEAVDTQRATEIMEAGRSGKIPTPEEQEFIRRYLEMYQDQLEP